MHTLMHWVPSPPLIRGGGPCPLHHNTSNKAHISPYHCTAARVVALCRDPLIPQRLSFSDEKGKALSLKIHTHAHTPTHKHTRAHARTRATRTHTHTHLMVP